MNPLKLLDVVPSWAWALALLAALALAGAQTVRLANAGEELATERAARSDENRVRAEAHATDLRQTARLQATHATRQQEATDAHHQRSRSREAALAAVRADNLGLRDAIAAYTAHRGGEAAGNAPACSGERDRATTLGQLLARTLDLAGRHTAAAEQHADEVRFLKALIANDRALCGGGS